MPTLPRRRPGRSWVACGSLSGKLLRAEGSRGQGHLGTMLAGGACHELGSLLTAFQFDTPRRRALLYGLLKLHCDMVVSLWCQRGEQVPRCVDGFLE